MGRGGKAVLCSPALRGYCKKKAIVSSSSCLCRIKQVIRSLILIRLRPQEPLLRKEEERIIGKLVEPLSLEGCKSRVSKCWSGMAEAQVILETGGEVSQKRI